jgi:hypothetical protein
MFGGVEGCVGGLDQVCGCVSFGLAQATDAAGLVAGAFG